MYRYLYVYDIKMYYMLLNAKKEIFLEKLVKVFHYFHVTFGNVCIVCSNTCII